MSLLGGRRNERLSVDTMMAIYCTILFANLLILALNLKLYTEFFKERVKGK